MSRRFSLLPLIAFIIVPSTVALAQRPTDASGHLIIGAAHIASDRAPID